MRSLILDELYTEEIGKIEAYLGGITDPGPIDGVRWLMLPENVLTETQKQLLSQKGPYKIPIEIGRNMVKFELVVKADLIHNEGGGPVSVDQLLYIYKVIDKMATDLKLLTCG